MSTESTSPHIAIVGMAGRFPGADDVRQFWQNLCAGLESITAFSDEELLSERVSPELLRDPRYVKAAPVLKDIDRFDAGFFQYSPREATWMDPQQRLFLECAWEALEDAGCDPFRFPGPIGLYAGQGPNVASYSLAYADAFREYLGQSGSVPHIGNDKDYLASRASYKLNLRGPSIAVQTACSSSLVAVHLACQSLLAGECEMALAGGASIRVPHRVGHLAEEGHIRSHDGHCRVFDARASGTIFGSGVALVVLSPLAEALRQGDRIYAVIRGSAVNNDGSDKLSYTVTSVPRQAEAIAEALAVAETPPETIGYVEAHGTATVVGDPLEFLALTQAFGNRAPVGACALGSVKANVGHLEIAAGVTGLIKAALALYHRKRPPTILFETPNPRIDFASSPFRIETELTPWERGPHPRRACVNSLGIGGTNAHVVLEEPPSGTPDQAAEPGRNIHVLPLSARSPEALQQLAGRYLDWFEAHPELDLGAVCYTAGVGRAHHELRVAVVVESADQARAALRELQSGGGAPGVARGRAGAAKVAWLFPDESCLYPGMARGLYESQPAFRDVLDRCAAALDGELSIGMLDVLFGSAAAANGRGPLLGQARYAQPALFAVEVGLARLYASWGLRPGAMLGYGVGEYAAACVAAAFEPEDGVRLLARRGRLMDDLAGGCRMAAIYAPAERVAVALADERHVALAADNGEYVMIGGCAEAVEAAVRRLGAEGLRCEDLGVGGTSHTPLVEPILDELEAATSAVAWRAAGVAWVSGVTGGALPAGMPVGASHWRRQAREPVRFAEGVRSLRELGCGVLLELGPGPVLGGMAAACWPGTEPPVAVAALRSGVGDEVQSMRALAELYVSGAAPDFGALAPAEGRRKVGLPTYPFQRQRYWINASSSAASNGAPGATLQSLMETPLEQIPQLLPFWGELGPREAEAIRRAVGFLRERHETELAAASLGGLLHRVAWQVAPAGPPGSSSDGRPWLILADRGGVGEQLAGQLRVAGHDCRTLLADDANALDMVIDSLAGDDRPPGGVAHLWSLDVPIGAGLEALDAMQQLSLHSTLALVQALLRWSLRVPVHLITRAAQAADGVDLVSPHQAPLWGLGRVLRLEHPELFGKLIDLPSSVGVEVVQSLANELLGGADEDQVALRDGLRLVPRLERVEPPTSPEPVPLRSDGSYLITGGLGALGLRVAGWLAERGARHLVLSSRRSADADSLEHIDRIQRRSECEIHVRTADVSDAEQVRTLLRWMDGELPELRGVIHCAGVDGRETLAEMSPPQLDAVLSAKVRGAWLLHEATRDRPLDLFVSFSSIAAVWGSRGQAHYAAANAFLDALTQCRQSLGLPAASVNFGPWDGGGMVDLEGQQRLGRVGVKILSPGRALAGLAAALSHPSRQLVVADVDWPKLLEVMQARGPLSLLAGMQADVCTSSPESGKTPLVGRLEQAPAASREGLLCDHVRGLVAEILGADPDQVDMEAGFFDLGMDSLLAVELRQRLANDLGCKVPATLAMDRPNIRMAVEYLLEEALGLRDDERAAAEVVANSAAVTHAHEPIAVVGLMVRTPGASSLEEFWRLLESGKDAVRDVPPERFDLDAYFDADPEARGKIYTRRGGFLDDLDQFDPQFFGISPREAASIDPQQRLVLETAWQALECAGIAADRLLGSRTGVYMGVAANEYGSLIGRAGDASIDAYFGTGNALNVIAGRVAFALGLRGPAMAIDTACSSSLVAVHQACQALHAGDCDLALAGGVNVVLNPQGIMATCRAHMLSPDGRCKTFDARADGYVRGEGCGVAVLKRLDDARRDGDRVLAVIRGSAINQDGASSGLTVPNGPAQEQVIAETLSRAGIAPADVSYLEAHGTGTSLGDPLEVQAAAKVLGRGRDPGKPLLIGSVKTNVGHLEAAAGIVGLVKVVLAMARGSIPKQLHFETPNPHIPWERLPVRVTAEATPWPEGRRIAGVSSFGFSGTNAHVVLEAEPEPPLVSPGQTVPGPSHHLLVLSGKTEKALMELTGRYVDWLDRHPETDLADLCFTAAAGRSHFEHRVAVVAPSAEQLRADLVRLAAGQESPAATKGRARARPKLAMVFTGQGSQYVGMARGLYDELPAFRQALDRCAAALEGELDRPLLELLFARTGPGGAASALDETRYAQPAMVAVEVALYELYASLGVEPDAVLGHSVGEYAAAYAAGVLGLEDALRLVARRGRLMGELPAGGAMAAVFADEHAVAAAAEAAGVEVAAYNGGHVVVSGPAGRVEGLVRDFERRGVRCVGLRTSHAFHSRLLEPALTPFERMAGGVEGRAPRRLLVSNLTGRPMEAGRAPDAAYWRRHAREPVRFAEGVRSLRKLGCTVLLELSPRPVLGGMAALCWPGSEPPACATALRPGVADGRQLREALGRLYAAGVTPDLAALWPAGRRRVDLPTYPFQRQRHWVETPRDRPTLGQPGHPLLGVQLELAATRQTVCRQTFSLANQPWIGDHRVYDAAVIPGVSYIAMTMAATGVPAFVADVSFQEPLILPDSSGSGRECELMIDGPADAPTRRFEVHSREPGEAGGWRQHAVGTVVGDPPPAEFMSVDLDALRRRLTPLSLEELAGIWARVALVYGPALQAVTRAWTADGLALSQIEVPESLAGQVAGEPIHPVLLDACTRLTADHWTFEEDQEDGVFWAPWQVKAVALLRPVPPRFYAYVDRPTRMEPRVQSRAYDIHLLDETGMRFGRIEGFTLKRAPREAFLRRLRQESDRLLYALRWQQTAIPEPDAPTRGTWLVLGERPTTGPISAELETRGYRVRQGEFADAETLLDHVIHPVSGNGDTSPLVGIAWLARHTPPGSADALMASCRDHVEPLLKLIKDLVDRGIGLPGGLNIVTRGAVASEPGDDVDPVQSALWGLGRTLQAEQPRLNGRMIDARAVEAPTLATALLAGTEPQLALRPQQALAPRLLPQARGGRLMVRSSGDYRLTIPRRGSLDHLQIESIELDAPAAGDAQIVIRAAGLNLRDVLNALGTYPGDAGPLGNECVGVVTAVGAGVEHIEVGDRVFGVTFGRGGGVFSSRANVDAALLARLPAGIDDARAATVPAAFCTAGLAFELTGLRAGERVLIHAATGGVGSAAIQLARAIGAEIYATTSEAKQDYLRDRGIQHIYDSRSTDFAERILRDTDGEGVGVVLNSLTSEGFIEASLASMGIGGRFVEIGKRGIWTSDRMAAARPDVTYHILALDDLMATQPVHVRRLLEGIARRLEAGELRPLPGRLYPLSEAPAAMRQMQQARHIGKIAFVMTDARIPEDGGYLITGGLGALGLSMAGWLAERRAGCIVLCGRREPGPEVREQLAALERAHGCPIVVHAADVADPAAVRRLIARFGDDLPPLRGLIHAAGVLDDGVVTEQTWSRFETVLGPKLAGAWNLHEATEPLELDFFCLCSSSASMLGAAGQSNYAAANAFLDGLAQYRRARGHPGVSINWGPWAGAGMAADAAIRTRLARQGLTPLKPEEAHRAMSLLLASGVCGAVVDADWQRMAKQVGDAHARMLSGLVSPATPQADGTLVHRLRETPSAARGRLIAAHIQGELQQILGLAEPPAHDSGFFDLGMDSLMAVELRIRLQVQVGDAHPLSSTLAFDFPTVQQLTRHLSEKLRAPGEDGPEAAAAQGPRSPGIQDDLRRLDEASVPQVVEELQRLLAVEPIHASR